MVNQESATIHLADELPSIGTRATRSAGAMFIAKSVRFGFIILLNFILINLLLPADFGLVRYVMLVVGIANLLNEMGLITAIIQRKQLDRTVLWSLFIISSLWGILLYLFILLLAPFISRYFNTPELLPLLRVGALMIPVAGISAVHRAWLRRQMAYEKLAFVEMGAAFLSAVVSVALALGGFGVWALVAGSLTFEAVISVLMLFMVRIPLSSLQPFCILRPLLFFGIAIIAGRLVDFVLRNAPIFLIGKTIGAKGLGLFSVAYDIALFPQMAIVAVLSNVLISTFSRIQSDPEKTMAAFARLLLFGSVLSMPVLLIMHVLPQEFLTVICFVKQNSAWIAAAPLLRWLAVTGIVYVFTTFSASVWLAQGKVIASIGVSVAMCITVIAAIVVGAHWGMQGICIGLFLRSIIVFPFYIYINYRITRIPAGYYIKTLFPSLAAGTVMAMLLFGLHHFIPGDSLQRHFGTLAGGAFVGITAYTGILFLFFGDAIKQLKGILERLMPQADSDGVG